MSAVSQSAGRRAFAWLVDRNPTYLLSACLVALGARGLLVDPADPAGDALLIFVTLAALQAYEWAVGAILIALHKARRAPEDAPSLLLVGTLFWTGPIAATLEMIALRPHLGTALTAGACVIAVCEMFATCRILGIRLRRSSYVIASASIALLAVSAPLLKMPITDSGINEILLYASWWAFGALILACRGVAKSYCNVKLAFPSVAVQSPSAGELGFLGITLAATAVHLCAMNYGFFCHAQVFYAAPAIVAASVVGVSLLHPFMKRFMVWIALFGALPLIAVALSAASFDAHVPIELLPRPLHHPLVPTLVIAAAAWFFAFARHRLVTFFHAASAAMGLACARAAADYRFVTTLPPRNLFVGVLGLVAAYLLVIAVVRRSRSEALVALAAAFAAIAGAVVGQTTADNIVTVIAFGWLLLAGVHLACVRPRLVYRLAPIAILAIVPWCCEGATQHMTLVIGHSAILIAALVVVGSLLPWTAYRSIALALMAVYAGGASTKWIVTTPSPTATVLTLAGFVLLLAGAAVSWNKERLLRLPPEAIADPGVAHASSPERSPECPEH